MNRDSRSCSLNWIAALRGIICVMAVSMLVLEVDAQPGAIERHPVQSTVLASVGYDAAKRLLEIEFRSGSIYRYLEVPGEIHRRLLAADSKGNFFGANIRDKFRCERVKSKTAK